MKIPVDVFRYILMFSLSDDSDKVIEIIKKEHPEGWVPGDDDECRKGENE